MLGCLTRWLNFVSRPQRRGVRLSIREFRFYFEISRCARYTRSFRKVMSFYVCLSLSLSLSVCLYLSICLPLSLSLSVSLPLSLSLSLSASISLSVSLAVFYLSLCSLPLSLFISMSFFRYPPTYPSIHKFIYLSHLITRSSPFFAISQINHLCNFLAMHLSIPVCLSIYLYLSVV